MPLSSFVINHTLLFRSSQSNPFLASSIFLAASPALYPPLLTHAMLPSPNSTLSSTCGNAQGQWWGKWTHLIRQIPRQHWPLFACDSLEAWLVRIAERTTVYADTDTYHTAPPHTATGTNPNLKACSAVRLVAGVGCGTCCRS